jgi:hypothetical protein
VNICLVGLRRSFAIRLATLPKDEPSVKEKPLEKKEREISNSKLPSSSFSSEIERDDTPPEGGFIEAIIEGLSRLFRDENTKSNRTRAKRLWGKTDLEEKEFVEAIQQAKRITANRWSSIRNSKMAYFFAVLENELGLGDGK